MHYTDPQSAARAWAEAHGWGAEPAPEDVGGLAFFFTTPARGRTPAKKQVAGYGTWPSFAGRLMAHQLVRKEPDGWTFD